MKLSNIYTLNFFKNSRNFSKSNLFLGFFVFEKSINTAIQSFFEESRFFFNFNLYQFTKKFFFSFFFFSYNTLINLKQIIVSVFLIISFYLFINSALFLNYFITLLKHSLSFTLNNFGFFILNNKIVWISTNLSFCYFSVFSKFFFLFFIQRLVSLYLYSIHSLLISL